MLQVCCYLVSAPVHKMLRLPNSCSNGDIEVYGISLPDSHAFGLIRAQNILIYKPFGEIKDGA